MAIPRSSALAQSFAGHVVTQVKPELRVLQIFSGLGVGGAETWLISLLRYFREYENKLQVKVQFDVLLTSGAKGTFDEEAIALGANLFYVPFTRGNALGFTRQFRRILRDGNYDVIHDHQDYIAGLHFLMGLGCLPPIRIAHVHNPLYHRANYVNGVVRRASRSAGKSLLAHLATHIMGTSRQIVTEYGFDSFRDVTLGVSHCGFDVSQFQGDREKANNEICRELGWPTSAKLILFVGRLGGAEIEHLGRRMNHKNPEFALDVARECMVRDERVRLVMVGDGAAKVKQFEERSKEWGLENRIRFLGVRHDVARLMLASDLLLFPSFAEGLGMVVVEAQAAGLRVLASDSTPREVVVVPELIEFLSLDASPSVWADETLRLLNLEPYVSGDLKRAMEESAFSIERSAANLLKHYHSSIQ